MKQHLTPYVTDILKGIEDLLIIHPIITRQKNDKLPIKDTDSAFDSQLYLFEALGFLVSLESIPLEQQIEFIKALFSPMLVSIPLGKSFTNS
jgi:exportin-T